MKLKNLVVLISLTYWPVSLYLANTPTDFLSYLIPLLVLLSSFWLYKNNSKFYPTPVLALPLFEPKLALLPIVFSIISLVHKRSKLNVFFVLFSFVVLTFSWQKFAGQTIFTRDYEANQKVIRDTQLYDSVIIARLFHNKARVVFDKFTFNLFALTDPNNYFFGFHPRQITTNQNLTKFPFIGIVFMLYGLYYLRESKHRLFIFTSLISSIAALSILKIFDRNDFILFVPLALIFVYGVYKFDKSFKHAKVVFVIFIVFIVMELTRIIST